MRGIFPVLTMAMILSLIIPGASPAAQSNRYELFTLHFETPVTFSTPEKCGLDAFSLFYPAGTKPGGREMEITLVLFRRGSLEAHKTTEGDLVNYVKSTFLGAPAVSGESVYRTWLGEKTMGERFETSIPKPSITEIFPLTLKDKSVVVVSFKFGKEMKEKLAESIISRVAETLREK